MSEGDRSIHIDLELMKGYQIRVKFDREGMPDLIMDEPEPLGGNEGPNPSRLLAASAAGCLSASLLFCLRKSRAEVKGLKAHVEATLVRNEQGRLRVGGLKVTITPEIDPSDRERLELCKTLFEGFCVVTQSIRQGIPVEVRVE